MNKEEILKTSRAIAAAEDKHAEALAEKIGVLLGVESADMVQSVLWRFIADTCFLLSPDEPRYQAWLMFDAVLDRILTQQGAQ